MAPNINIEPLAVDKYSLSRHAVAQLTAQTVRYRLAAAKDEYRLRSAGCWESFTPRGSLFRPRHRHIRLESHGGAPSSCASAHSCRTPSAPIPPRKWLSPHQLGSRYAELRWGIHLGTMAVPVDGNQLEPAAICITGVDGSSICYQWRRLHPPLLLRRLYCKLDPEPRSCQADAIHLPGPHQLLGQLLED